MPRWLCHVVFWKGAHFFEYSILGKEIDFLNLYPTYFHKTKCIAYADMSTFHKHTACLILHVFANICSKCKCEHFQHLRHENYICFKCLQILHAEYAYAECLWIVLILKYALYFVLLKLVGCNLRKVQFPYPELSDFTVKKKSVHPSKTRVVRRQCSSPERADRIRKQSLNIKV